MRTGEQQTCQFDQATLRLSVDCSPRLLTGALSNACVCQCCLQLSIIDEVFNIEVKDATQLSQPRIALSGECLVSVFNTLQPARKAVRTAELAHKEAVALIDQVWPGWQNCFG